MDEVKRRVRKLKPLEKRIRWGGEEKNGASLVWDALFDVRETPTGKAKYNLAMLSSMDREEYKRVVDEYFARVYYEFYLENGITDSNIYDPSVLALLGLPFSAEERDIKKRFRELAKKCHPDTGGDSKKFIELMQVYERLTRVK